MADDKSAKPTIPHSAAEVNIKVMGSKKCDNAAIDEAYRVIGLDPKAKPIDGVSEHFELFSEMFPQLRDEHGWNAKLNIEDPVTHTVSKDITNVHLLAAMLAGSKFAVEHGITDMKDVPVKDIIAGMPEPLAKLRKEAPAVCKIGDKPQKATPLNER